MSGAGEPVGLPGLEGRVALVTGGSGGIGSAVVRLLGRSGVAVASADLPERPVPEGAFGLAADLAEPAGVQEMFDGFRRRFDRLDVLVHCTGITADAVLWKMDPADWSRVLRVNLDSAFLVLREVAPLLRRAGEAAVVLVSSINGERGKFGQSNYAASKAGLIGLGRTAARELGRFGVRVNVVAPGLIATPMSAGLADDIRVAAVAETVLGRIGSPEDVAHAVLFLVSPLSRHVTGQVLRVDGGQLIA